MQKHWFKQYWNSLVSSILGMHFYALTMLTKSCMLLIGYGKRFSM